MSTDIKQENQTSTVFSTLKTGDVVYGRLIHESSLELCSQLSKLYTSAKQKEATKCVLATSGMNAIYQTFSSILNNEKNKLNLPINIISSNELYCDTPRSIDRFAKMYNATYHKIDPTDCKSCINLFESFGTRKTINILFVESCSNPSGFVFDFRILSQLKKLSNKLYVIVDNTWLTSIVFNPFDFKEVDVVVNSLTKYYSNGICIAGAILTQNNNLYNNIMAFSKFTGMHVSPIHCRMILNELVTLSERIQKSSQLTFELIQRLEKENPLIWASIKHPAMINHPSHELAKLFFKFHPSIFSFIQSLSKEDAIAWMKHTGITFKTSYGAAESRFCSFPKIVNEKATLCRLSVGWNDSVETLLKKLTL